MRSFQSTVLRFTAVFIAAGSLAGCSLKGAGSDNSLYVDLSSLKNADSAASKFALLNSRSTGFYGLSAPPTTSTGFSCYAVNVTGPGIVETGSGSHLTDPMIDFYKVLNVPGAYCNYRGVVTPALFLDGTGSAAASLQVPPGDVRLVQIVGVNDPLVCASGVIDDPAGSAGGSGRFFEVGRTVVNGLFGDRSVDVVSTWPTTAALQAARKIDCGSGSCTNVDHSLGTAPSSRPLSASSTKIAQRIPKSPGQYIRSVDLDLTVTAVDTITVTIYQTAVGVATPSLGDATLYTVSLPMSVAAPITTFDLHSASGYLQMVATSDYWIVVSSANNNGLTYWADSGGLSSDIASYTASTWISVTGVGGMNYRLATCGSAP